MELDEQPLTDKSNLGGSIMTQLIDKIYRILNACKGFTVGYSSDTVSDGYFYIEYEGKAYAVKMVEMPMSNEKDSFSRVDQVQYYI